MAGTLRGKLRASADYLTVAPTVVAVARDIDLPPTDTGVRPLQESQAESVRLLAEKWGLKSPVERVLTALSSSA